METCLFSVSACFCFCFCFCFVPFVGRRARTQRDHLCPTLRYRGDGVPDFHLDDSQIAAINNSVGRLLENAAEGGEAAEMGSGASAAGQATGAAQLGAAGFRWAHLGHKEPRISPLAPETGACGALRTALISNAWLSVIPRLCSGPPATTSDKALDQRQAASGVSRVRAIRVEERGDRVDEARRANSSGR